MDDMDVGSNEQIVRQHAGWIYSCALRRVGERLAGDVTQAVFILWWQKGHALAGTPPPASDEISDDCWIPLTNPR